MKKGGSQVLLVFAFFLCLYLFTAKGRITVHDGWVRYIVTQSIVDRSTIALPPGATHWRFQSTAVAYSFYPLGQSLAGIPLYLVGKTAAGWVSSADPAALTRLAYSLLNCFFTAALCAVFFSFCLQLGYSRNLALLLTLALGLGTVFWQQSKDSFEHPQETLFGLAGLMYSHRGLRQNRGLPLLAAGACFGAGLLSRESALFFFFPALVYILVAGGAVAQPANSGRSFSFRRAVLPVLLCLAGALPFLLIIAWYNQVRWGSPWVEGHVAAGSFSYFHASLLRGMIGLLFSPGRGIFWYNPALLLLLIFPSSMVGFWRRTRGLGILFGGIGLCYLLFYARFPNWADGLSWGPRYIIPVLPLAFLAVGELMETLAAKPGAMLPRKFFFKRYLVGLLLGLGLLIQLPVILVDHQIWFYEVAVRNSQGEHLAINSDPRNSPLLHQWLSLERVLTGKKLPELDRRVIANPSQDFCTGIDVWWLCPPTSLGKTFRFGGAGLLALLVVVFGWRLLVERRREGENFTPL